MKNLLSCLGLLFLSVTIFGQNKIDGYVFDEKNNAVFFATVALYTANDSTFLSAVSTNEEGFFEFNDIENGSYYINTTMLGYADQSLLLSLPGDGSNELNFSLVQDINLLSTVEIKDRLPLLEQKADKLIVNVENNMSNTSGSLLDVMKKVPGMVVINDRLSMAGQSNPTILLNGKSTQYMDVQALLKDMPGDNIKKVEIIHQPGAEYDAEGSGPIINIILKKNSLFGTNGNVTLGVGKGKLWDYTTGLNLSHYQGRFNVTGGLGYSHNAWVEEINLFRTLNTSIPDINGLYDQTSNDAAKPKTYRGNLRLDWDLTDKHRLGVDSKYYNNSNSRISTNITTVDLFDESLQDYTLDTENDKDRGWNYYSINPYYIFEIDTSGQKLEFDVSTARYQIDAFNVLSTTNSIDNEIERRRYTQPGDTKIFASSLDYTKPLNKFIELKTGVKYSEANLDNDLLSEYEENGEWKNNLQQSNHYLFDETIYAAYTKLSWSAGEWSGTAGLRYEKSESVGNSLTLNETLNRDISKFFPSFSLSKELFGPLSSSVAYSYRIDRPRYSTLNPFVYYLDPFTFEQGNPNLRPELTHSAKFSLAFEGQPFFNIEYKKSTDAIVEVTEQQPNTEEASKTDINFDDQRLFSLSLFFPLDFIPGVTGYGGVISGQNSYSSFYNDGSFEESKWNTTAFIQAEFTLPGDINAELGGWYTSGQQEGIFKSEYLYGTSFGLSKKILKDKAKISLGVEDFINRFWHASVDYQQDLEINVKWQAPVVNARFSYKFGNQHLKSKQKTESSAAEVLKRARQN